MRDIRKCEDNIKTITTEIDGERVKSLRIRVQLQVFVKMVMKLA